MKLGLLPETFVQKWCSRDSAEQSSKSYTTIKHINHDTTHTYITTTYIHTYIHTYMHACMHASKQASKQTNKQANKQTARHNLQSTIIHT